MPDQSATSFTERRDILIVEDEHISRHALASLLSASGYQTAAYGSAEEALLYADHHPTPLVALVDVDLPGISGLELIARLRQVYPSLHAVLITAAEGERIDRFRHDHSVGYFRKPLEFTRLLELLSESEPH